MDHNLQSVFARAEATRHQIETSFDLSGSQLQEKILHALAEYEGCRQLADHLAVFSPNEALEDITTESLRYLLIDYHLAELRLRTHNVHRRDVLKQAQALYARYLDRLDNYDVLSPDEQKLYERYREDPHAFSTASKTDAAARRDTKIARFRLEKELKSKIQYLEQHATTSEDNEPILRESYLENTHLRTHEAFASLEAIAQELDILAMAPATPPSGPDALAHDQRERDGTTRDSYSDRLDSSMLRDISKANKGPVLSQAGKPLGPFTLLDTRDRLRQGVFKSGHNLPTMTIDEYLEEEKRRGGMIEGGGEQSGRRPEPDEDDYAKADEETRAAREWDEYKEANPKYVKQRRVLIQVIADTHQGFWQHDESWLNC
ncbi:MAG: hypothetical protein M1817_005428 [Caeruleum heppii]|nr:MAG: hypothetical protein M1817_005428 [Caeruleum heppii]